MNSRGTGEKGLLGNRVYVADDSGESLWLADDMADAVWVAPDVDSRRCRKEILRVLHPGGVCIMAGKATSGWVESSRLIVKPAQPGVDEWRHPNHGPDNNVVSQDSVARLPGELRFQTYYRPGGGEGRTVYVDIGTRKLADYEGVVRPGCFDGVVPANGRLYWIPLAADIYS